MAFNTKCDMAFQEWLPSDKVLLKGPSEKSQVTIINYFLLYCTGSWLFITFKSFDVVFVVLLVRLTCLIHYALFEFSMPLSRKCAFCLVQGGAFVHFFYAPWSDLLAPPWDIRRPFERKKWQIPGKKGTGMLAIDLTNITNRPFYSYGWKRGWGWPCFDTNLLCFVMEIVLEKY